MSDHEKMRQRFGLAAIGRERTASVSKLNTVKE
jgi:hypothetical protein